MLTRDAKPHAQAKILRRFTRLGIAARVNDLFELFLRVEAEGLHTMGVVRFADRRLRLDRVHKAQLGVGQQAANQPHLGNRSNVVVFDARFPQNLNKVRRRIGFHRVEHLARKLLNEETSGAPGGVRAIEDDRLFRRQNADYRTSVRVSVQFKGPPEGLAAEPNGFEAALRLVSLGAAEARNRFYRFAMQAKSTAVAMVPELFWKAPFPISSTGRESLRIRTV